jgi:uncharacterized protein YciU (UPF0263 family)
VVFGDYTVSANPYVNAAMTGLANNFDSESDVMNEFVGVGWQFNEIGTEGDTAVISWVDGAMKIEAKYDWDYAMAKFLISEDLTETIDISNNIHINFKYKNLMPAEIALVASFRNDVGDGELLYGGEVWLEGEDVVYGSDEWNTIDMDFAIEDVNIDKVVLLEIGFDGIGNGSVLIDDVVFGDIMVSTEKISAPRSGIQVFPNPASDFLRIRNAGPTFDVMIFNAVGQQVLNVQNQEEIDISALDSGLYFIQVAGKGARSTFKVLVE